MTPTDRERFCAMLTTGPIQRGDAIVVLTGDGTARLATAAQLLMQDAAPLIVISGGLHKPPYSLTADAMKGALMGFGIAPDRIRVDMEAMNTAESAVNVADTAKAEHWTSVLLVTSPDHQYRAFLTFLAALMYAGLEETVRLVNIPCSNLRWSETPAGRDRSRLDLLAEEFEKCDAYARDVALFADGVRYLTAWEGR